MLRVQDEVPRGRHAADGRGQNLGAVKGQPKLFSVTWWLAVSEEGTRTPRPLKHPHGSGLRLRSEFLSERGQEQKSRSSRRVGERKVRAGELGAPPGCYDSEPQRGPFLRASHPSPLLLMSTPRTRSWTLMSLQRLGVGAGRRGSSVCAR